MNIVSIDPGITTGYAIAILDTEVLYVSYAQEKFSHRNLWDMLTEIEPAYVICESFEYRNNRHRNNLELYPLELIGVVKLFTDPNNLTMQNAAKGKGFYTDEKLKKMDLYIPGLQHGRDAARHLLHWFTFGPGYQYNTKGTKIVLGQLETLMSKI
jgi:hypothetical protein